MTCPKCGSAVFVGASFCGQCGATLTPSRFPAPPAAPPVARAPFRRPLGVTLLAVLDLIGGAFLGLAGLGFLATSSGTAQPEGVIALQVMGAITVVFSLLYVAAGIGLLGLKPWGRIAQMILAGIGLLVFPLGTIVSILILYYLTRPGVKLLFSGRAPNELTLEEYQSAERDAAKGAIVAVTVVAVVLLGVVSIGVIAAIAIPGLLQARKSGNEASAVARMRAMITAQTVYSTANNGQYGTLECLVAPSQCLADYPPSSPPFLSRDQATDAWHAGYEFRFFRSDGSDAVESRAPAGKSFSAWVYVAQPVTAGSSGVRSFCADSTARVCAYQDGRTPRPVAGRCPADCEDLR